MLDRKALTEFANAEIADFHASRLRRLEGIQLADVLRKKNPYLFKAKNMERASDLILAIMDAFLSSSEEEMFGQFLEKLAVFVSEQACGGKKSSAKGIDLEFDRDGVRYLVAVKSGPNWGNSSQYAKLEQDFRAATVVQRQGRSSLHVQPVLGMCYGRQKSQDKGLYRKIAGQGLWHFLSGDEDLYLDIIEPIGHRAREHNEWFQQRRAAIENRLTLEFAQAFCAADGSINWAKLVAFNSANL
jgi:hypothetical protein